MRTNIFVHVICPKTHANNETNEEKKSQTQISFDGGFDGWRKEKMVKSKRRFSI